MKVRQVVDTRTGEIMDLAPSKQSIRPKPVSYKRRPVNNDDSALVIGLLGLLVAAIAITK